MNLTKCYINFKRNQIINCSKLIYNINDQFFYECLDKFTTIYIQTRYYKFYETFDEKNVLDNNLKVILEELKGKKVEIELENEDKNLKLVDLAYYLVFYSIKFELSKNEDKLKELIDTCLSGLNINDNSVFFNLKKYINQIRNKEQKFILSLNIDEYQLKYTNFKNRRYDYKVELLYDIKQLDNYSKTSIVKNFNDSDVSYNKMRAMFNLLNRDIILKLISNEELDKYFIYVDDKILDSDLFEMINNEYLRKYIILVVDFDNYNNQKKKLNNLNKYFDLCGCVDMSHINDVDSKLDSLEHIDLFKYYLLDKVKNKDYEFVIKYDFVSKIGFVNEFEKE